MRKPSVTTTLVIAGCSAAVCVGALFVARHGGRDFVAIHSCLDAGESWNYETRACEQ